MPHHAPGFVIFQSLNPRLAVPQAILRQRLHVYSKPLAMARYRTFDAIEHDIPAWLLVKAVTPEHVDCRLMTHAAV